MTKRTFVGYWRLFWSWLITGAAKDKTTLSPSCEAPSIKDEKNIGQLNMENPYAKEIRKKEEEYIRDAKKGLESEMFYILEMSRIRGTKFAKQKRLWKELKAKRIVLSTI